MLVELASADLRQVCASCGDLSMRRQFTAGARFKMADWMSDEAYSSRARNRQWMERPEIQKQIRAGIYDSESPEDRIHAETGEQMKQDESFTVPDFNLDDMTEQMMARGFKTTAELEAGIA
jgi:hypothetical protein